MQVRHLLLYASLLVAILLQSCGSGTTDIATLKDSFAYQDKTEFNSREIQSEVIHALNAIEDEELEKALLKQLYPDLTEQALEGFASRSSLYLYSWHGTRGENRHFSLLHDRTDYEIGEDDISIFYVIADPSGKFIARETIAEHMMGGDMETYLDGFVAEDQIMLNYVDVSYNPEDFRQPRTQQTCTISDAAITCNEAKEIYNLVCLWPNLSVRETASDDGKYLNAMRLGETALSFGETVTDEESAKKRQFVDVTLSDGTKGWIREDLVAVNAVAAAVAAETKIYRRPDPLTMTGDAFQPLDLVAIYERDGDYVKVKGIPQGESWYKEGWASNEHLWQGANVAVASLYQDALAEKDPVKSLQKIESILQNKELEEAHLYTVLKEVTGMGTGGGDINPDFSAFTDQFLEVYTTYETEMMSEMGEGSSLSDAEVGNWLGEEENIGYEGVGILKNLGGLYTGLLVEYSPGSSSNQALYLFNSQGDLISYVDIMKIESANAPDQTHVRGRVSKDEVYLEYMRTWWEGDPAEEDAQVNNAYWIQRFEIDSDGLTLTEEGNVEPADFELFDIGGA